MTSWLLNGLLKSAERFGERPALSVDGHVLTYTELLGRAAELAASNASSDAKLTGILAARSVSAYASVVAALLGGEAYMPLNPRFPTSRLVYMLEHSGCDHLIADGAHLDQLEALLEASTAPLKVLMADASDVTEIAARHPRHSFLPGAEQRAQPHLSSGPEPDDVAYLLYTSGSTGRPKGVAVSHANVSSFLNVCSTRYDFDEHDRFSQMFDLGFDLSVFDLFVAWSVGACVCVPRQGEQMLPREYMARDRISVWFSVPSIGVLLNRLGILQEGAFPSLRWALFCGEALPSDVALSWLRAAPNAKVENLYGPTEATIACTGFRVSTSCGAEPNVPIGFPFEGMTAKVVDDGLREVEPGEEGELLVSGPQIAIGYWNDQEKTAAAFVVDPATGIRSYRTGDLVRRPALEDMPLTYIGRIDQQIKFHGQRIELGEIESVFRELSGASTCVVVGRRAASGAIESLAAFLEADQVDAQNLRARARVLLPDYMVPREVYAVAHLPLNSNGKIDRGALAGMLV